MRFAIDNTTIKQLFKIVLPVISAIILLGIFPGNSYAGFPVKKEAYNNFSISNEVASTNALGKIGNFASHRYGRKADINIAAQAFTLGLVGVGIFSWFLLSIQFFLAAEFAFWIVAALVFLFGTEAFWGGLDIIKENMAGKFFAVMAMIFGVITIIPPVEWALMFTEAVMESALNRFDRFVNKLLFPRYYKRLPGSTWCVHIRRPYYKWYKSRFS